MYGPDLALEVALDLADKFLCGPSLTGDLRRIECIFVEARAQDRRGRHARHAEYKTNRSTLRGDMAYELACVPAILVHAFSPALVAHSGSHVLDPVSSSRI